MARPEPRREVIGSNPIGHSDFFSVSRLWHNQHFTQLELDHLSLSQLVSTSCYTCRASRYFWHNRFDCNFQTRLVDQSPEDVNRETTAPLPIRALGTRRPCLELKNAPLRRRAASGDPEVPHEATSPPHLTCPHSLIRNNSSLEENQVRRGFGCEGRGVGCE